MKPILFSLISILLPWKLLLLLNGDILEIRPFSEELFYNGKSFASFLPRRLWNKCDEGNHCRRPNDVLLPSKLSMLPPPNSSASFSLDLTNRTCFCTLGGSLTSKLIMRQLNLCNECSIDPFVQAVDLALGLHLHWRGECVGGRP